MKTYESNELKITQAENESSIEIKNNTQSEVIINTCGELTLTIHETPKSETVYRIKRTGEEKVRLNILGDFTCKYILDDIKSGFDSITFNEQEYEQHTKNHIELGRYKYDFAIKPPLQIFHTVDNIEVGMIDKNSEEFKEISKKFKENIIFFGEL